MIGLSTRKKITGLDKLAEYIKLLKSMALLKDNGDFQEYIQKKCLDTVNEMSNRLLPSGELKELYISNNKIEPYVGGFIISNSTDVDTDTPGYGGHFSIALAFEYGTGIVGEQNPVPGAWEYNVNHHTSPWVYYANGSYHITAGMTGYEVYRFAREEIEKNTKDWVFDYCKEKGVSIS